jgi:hypothetical protein
VITLIVSLAVALVVTTLGHRYAREMVSRKLRYVPAAQSTVAPFIAGVGATVLALPVVALVPIIGVGTALVFGLSVGLGAAAGARDVKGRLGGF